MGISRLPPVHRCAKMVVYYHLLAGGRFELAMQLTAIGLVSLNYNSETHMTVICEWEGADFTGIYKLWAFKVCSRKNSAPHEYSFSF